MTAKKTKPKSLKATKDPHKRKAKPLVHAVSSQKPSKTINRKSSSRARKPSAPLSYISTPPIQATGTKSAVSPSTKQGSHHTIRHLLWLLSWPIRLPFVLIWREKWRLVCLVLLASMILFIPAESARQSTQDERYGSSAAEIQKVPQRDVALVFGAGVLADHAPTPYLKHRVETAVDLYKAGRVKSILMSGNNSSAHNNETTTMKAYTVSLGVDQAAITVDPLGLNTYNTCRRAHSVYKLNSVTVVTQGYHLPRAVITCIQSGMDTIGVAAKSTGRDWTIGDIVREQLATGKAYAQNMLHPQLTQVSTVKSTTVE